MGCKTSSFVFCCYTVWYCCLISRLVSVELVCSFHSSTVVLYVRIFSTTLCDWILRDKSCWIKPDCGILCSSTFSHYICSSMLVFYLRCGHMRLDAIDDLVIYFVEYFANCWISVFSLGAMIPCAKLCLVSASVMSAVLTRVACCICFYMLFYLSSLQFAYSVLYDSKQSIFIYVSAQRSVARGIMVLSCSCVRSRVRPKTLWTRYIAEYLTHFHQTYITDAL